MDVTFFQMFPGKIPQFFWGALAVAASPIEAALRDGSWRSM